MKERGHYAINGVLGPYRFSGLWTASQVAVDKENESVMSFCIPKWKLKYKVLLTTFPVETCRAELRRPSYSTW